MHWKYIKETKTKKCLNTYFPLTSRVLDANRIHERRESAVFPLGSRYVKIAPLYSSLFAVKLYHMTSIHTPEAQRVYRTNKGSKQHRRPKPSEFNTTENVRF